MTTVHRFLIFLIKLSERRLTKYCSQLWRAKSPTASLGRSETTMPAAERRHYGPPQPFTPRWLPCVLRMSTGATHRSGLGASAAYAGQEGFVRRRSIHVVATKRSGLKETECRTDVASGTAQLALGSTDPSRSSAAVRKWSARDAIDPQAGFCGTKRAPRPGVPRPAPPRRAPSSTRSRWRCCRSAADRS